MKTVVTELVGGLGNQLFQYAMGRALSEKLSAPLYLSREHFGRYTLRKYELFRYRIQENFVTPEILEGFNLSHRFRKRTFLDRVWGKLLPPKPKPGFKEVLEKVNYVFDPKFLDPQSYEANIEHLYLTGYWQAPQYFESVESKLRNEFQLKQEPMGLNREWINRFQSEFAVSLHIRRGDYVSHAVTAKYHGSCSPEYYQAAVARVASELKPEVLVIFSDDINWCKQNLTFPIPMIFAEHNPPENGHEDMRLMQYCQAHIIANSSFSWWGAWLAAERSKMVIAPEKWTQQQGNTKIDIYPKRWILL